MFDHRMNGLKAVPFEEFGFSASCKSRPDRKQIIQQTAGDLSLFALRSSFTCQKRQRFL
jgi:hypothetical protein